MLNIGDRIANIRTSKNMSVYKLAKESDVAENHIRAIEKGKNQPTIITLEKILNGLGVNFLEFFNENDECMYPTNFELELINAIRLLDDEQSESVLNMIKLFNKN